MRLFHQEAMLDDDYTKEYYLDAEQIYNKEDSLSGESDVSMGFAYDETNLGGIHQFVAAGIWQQLN
jgi:hypothetical protein